MKTRSIVKESSMKYLIAFTLLACSIIRAQPSPYFPETGAKAVAEEIREIENPGVFLVIAIAPGFEDLASIAGLRIGSGAAVSVVYVTNGEDIPSDLNGEMFYQLASRRKEEAYNALSSLGVQAYFLNIPPNEFPAGGCFHATTELGKMLDSRLDSVISQVKPDIILLDHDVLSGSRNSPRLEYLQNRLVRDIHAGTRMSWSIEHLFVQSGGKGKTSRIPVDRKDPLWSKSYLEMAREADEFFESLRFEIPLWNEHKFHRYAQLYPVKAGAAFPLDKRLPEIGRELKTLLPAVHLISSIEKVPDREGRLAILRNVISKIDAFTVRYEYSLAPSDLRVLTTWKIGAEKMRCAILGVAIPYSVTDTVVTPIQLFFLKFGRLNSTSGGGKTQVLFPGVVQKQWIVNEAQKEFYGWTDSAQFRVLSPRSIPLNSTETPEGFEALQVRTPFIFIVVHQDPDQNRDFTYREEIPLIIAPYRSIEVLTPHVVMLHDTSIVVRFISNVRDRSGGMFCVNDSIVSSPQREVELPGKDVVVTDTLPLVWKDTLLTAPRQVNVLGGRKGASVGQEIPIGSFIVHRIDVKISIRKNVGLCTVIKNGPVQIALQRLGVTAAMLDTAKLTDEYLSTFSAIIVDQFSLRRFLGSSERINSMKRWINDGGRLIIFSQYGPGQADFIVGNEIGFHYLPVVGCGARVDFDSTEELFHSPNEINKSGFSGEPFVISYGGIKAMASKSSRILMSSGADDLLLEEGVGQGAIFYCALNLYPRLLSIDESSYKLLANLLSN
jgi:hypothetical protein